MRYLVAIFLLLISINSYAQNRLVMQRYIEGVDYQLLPAKVKTVSDDSIEVTEAFSYLCGHCYHFEPILNKWKEDLAEDVTVVKLPVIFQSGMQHYAQIMYSAEALGISEQINAATFAAIHVQKNRLRTEQDVLKLFLAEGISSADFKTVFNSPAVKKSVAQASLRTREMRIQSTPQMIVDGQYSVTVTRELGQEGMLRVVDFLISKVRAASH